jgi:N-acetylglutamate synthase-like GNAT family acetyltransferase
MSLKPDDILEQTQWDFFWIPQDAHVVDRPELLYVHCPRDVAILNCVTRTRAGSEQLPALVEEVQKAHQGVRSRWLVRKEAWTEPLEKALASHGYTPAVHMYPSAIDVRDYRKSPGADFKVVQVSNMSTLKDCVSVIAKAFPAGLDCTEEQLEIDLENCTKQDARVRRFVAYDKSGAPVSSGGMTLFPKLKFGLLWAGGTIPQSRGRGAYTAVLSARIASARALGFELVGLYAISNTSAPIVARQGFKRFGEMNYWERLGLLTPILCTHLT